MAERSTLLEQQAHGRQAVHVRGQQACTCSSCQRTTRAPRCTLGILHVKYPVQNRGRRVSRAAQRHTQENVTHTLE
jgi:hypothetical protein